MKKQKQEYEELKEQDLIREVSDYAGYPITVTKKIVTSLKETIIDNLRNDKKVRLIGFGSFEPFIRHKRNGVNPNSPNKIIPIKEVRVAKFRTGYKLKRFMKKK